MGKQKEKQEQWHKVKSALLAVTLGEWLTDYLILVDHLKQV